MAELFTSNELAVAIPGLPATWTVLFHAAANSAVLRIAPCLGMPGADEGARAEAKLIAFRAIDRLMGAPAYAQAETRGPFSITYITGGRGILDADDKAALKALCSTTAPSAGPLGDFPEPDYYDHLFMRPGVCRHVR